MTSGTNQSVRRFSCAATGCASNQSVTWSKPAAERRVRFGVLGLTFERWGSVSLRSKLAAVEPSRVAHRLNLSSFSRMMPFRDSDSPRGGAVPGSLLPCMPPSVVLMVFAGVNRRRYASSSLRRFPRSWCLVVFRFEVNDVQRCVVSIFFARYSRDRTTGRAHAHVRPGGIPCAFGDFVRYPWRFKHSSVRGLVPC